MVIEMNPGPSKLDERLEAFFDSETGHKMIEPDQAKSLLLDSLLADFRIRLNKNSLPGVSKTQPQIEVLAEIANLSEGVAYDFDDLLERYKEENNNSDKTHSGGVYVSKPPAQPEI